MLDNIKEFFSNYGAIIIIAILLVIIIISEMKKNKVLKVILITVLMFVSVVSAGYSIYQLNGYYTAKGGIHGSITGTENSSVIVDNLKFNFLNMELKKNENEEYEAVIESDAVLDISKSKTYEVFVRDEPCQIIEYANDYIIAVYSYNFYDKTSECVVNDSLTFKFSFFNKKTKFSISSTGNSQAIKYWNQYFNNNGFEVEIKLADEEKIYISGSDLNVVEGEVNTENRYVVASFSIDGTFISEKLVKVGDKVNYPTLSAEFKGWSLDGTNLIPEDYVISDNTIFTAIRYTDKEYCELAFASLENGVLDLSIYPIKRIPENQFSGRAIITDVKLPDTLEVIEACAFQSTNIKTLNCPNGLKEIHNKAFAYCFELSEVNLNEGLLKIGSCAFQKCLSLKTIELPLSLEQISVDVGGSEAVSNYTFYGCSDLVIECKFYEKDDPFAEEWNSNGSDLLDVNYKEYNQDEESGDVPSDPTGGKKPVDQENEYGGN